MHMFPGPILRAALAVLAAWLLAGCAARAPGSPAAQTLAEGAGYPPAAWPITSTFRDRHDSRGIRRRSGHSGIDIRAPAGTLVVAAAAGRVRVVEDRRAGRVVLLETDDTPDPLLLEFAHLEEVRVASGDVVARGQPIATVGRSGADSGGIAHLHFAVARGGRELVDPAPLLLGPGGIVCASRDVTSAAQDRRVPPLVYPVACGRR